jgi:hypothetical protein
MPCPRRRHRRDTSGMLLHGISPPSPSSTPATSPPRSPRYDLEAIGAGTKGARPSVPDRRMRDELGREVRTIELIRSGPCRGGSSVRRQLSVSQLHDELTSRGLRRLAHRSAAKRDVSTILGSYKPVLQGDVIYSWHPYRGNHPAHVGAEVWYQSNRAHRQQSPSSNQKVPATTSKEPSTAPVRLRIIVRQREKPHGTCTATSWLRSHSKRTECTPRRCS